MPVPVTTDRDRRDGSDTSSSSTSIASASATGTGSAFRVVCLGYYPVVQPEVTCSIACVPVCVTASLS